jgi:hypothetical protein
MSENRADDPVGRRFRIADRTQMLTRLAGYKLGTLISARRGRLASRVRLATWASASTIAGRCRVASYTDRVIVGGRFARIV